MLCSKCGERESTGYVFTLCDPCFDVVEAKIKADAEAAGGEPVRLSDVEFVEMFGQSPTKDGN